MRNTLKFGDPRTLEELIPAAVQAARAHLERHLELTCRKRPLIFCKFLPFLL